MHEVFRDVLLPSNEIPCIFPCEEHPLAWINLFIQPLNSNYWRFSIMGLNGERTATCTACTARQQPVNSLYSLWWLTKMKYLGVKLIQRMNWIPLSAYCITGALLGNTDVFSSWTRLLVILASQQIHPRMENDKWCISKWAATVIATTLKWEVWILLERLANHKGAGRYRRGRKSERNPRFVRPV